MPIKFQYKGEIASRLSPYSQDLLRERWNQIRKTAVDIQTEARRVHRFKTRSGNLERSIDVDINDNSKVAKVGFNKSIAKYGVFQHDGTKGPYSIVPKTRKALRFVLNGKFAFAKKVEHPGLKANRFIHNAFNRMKKKLSLGFGISIKIVRGKYK